MKRSALLLALPFSLALALGGCGGDSSGGTGTLSVAMTDAPSCGYDHVYVTVDRVRVNQSDSAGVNDPGWHEVALATPQKIDLLSLSNGVLTALGQTPLPAGHYEQVRLMLVPNTGSSLQNSIVPTGGTEQALSTPSATQSGYKVVGSFDVAANTLVDLVLDFDACHSVVLQGNGSYALKPVVKATPMAVGGSISGYVATGEAGAMVFAEQNGVVIKGTVADSTGKFVLSPVVQTSGSGGYDVVIAQPGYATAMVRAVPVTAGATTSISTSTVPFVLPTSGTHMVSGTVSPASADAMVDAQQSTGGGVYTVGSTNAALDTGAYSMTLASGAPLVGDYTGTLPVVLAADASAAGLYTMKATTALGATQSVTVDLSTADAINVNFSF